MGICRCGSSLRDFTECDSQVKDACSVHLLDKQLSIKIVGRLHCHLAVCDPDLDISEGAEDIVQKAFAVGAGNDEGGVAGCCRVVHGHLCSAKYYKMKQNR